MVISNAAYVGSILGFETKPTREHYLNKSAKKIEEKRRKKIFDRTVVSLN